MPYVKVDSRTTSTFAPRKPNTHIATEFIYYAPAGHDTVVLFDTGNHSLAYKIAGTLGLLCTTLQDTDIKIPKPLLRQQSVEDPFLNIYIYI